MVLKIFFVIVFLILSLVQTETLLSGPFDKLPFNPLGKKESISLSRADLDAVYKDLEEAEKLLQKSVDLSFKMLASKEEISLMEERMKKIDEIKDPKEREAALLKVQEDKMATVQKAVAKEESSKKIQQLNNEQKVMFGYAIYNIFLAIFKDKDALMKSKSFLDQIKGNPSLSMSFAGDVNKLTAIVTKLPSQIDKISTFGNTMLKFAKDNKIDVHLPKSSTDQPKEVKDF